MDIIKPRTLSGFMELLPDKQIKLEKMMEILRSRGVKTVSLEVRESNAAARGLYEKSGFTCRGGRKNFYREPRENAAIYLMEI